MGWMKTSGTDAELRLDNITLDSQDYGVEVFPVNEIPYPARDVTMIAVPGRNGMLSMDNGRWENVDLSFWVAAPMVEVGGQRKTGREAVEGFLAQLKAYRGYIRIQTDDDENFYRFGVLREAHTATVSGTESGARGMLYKALITFDCKPQRYAVDGFEPITVPANGSAVIRNPYAFTASPLIRMAAAGTIRTGSEYAITLTQDSGYPGFADIDCEAMDCYMQGWNVNRYVTVSTVKTWFPIRPNNNQIINGTSAPVVIRPRWWTL